MTASGKMFDFMAETPICPAVENRSDAGPIQARPGFYGDRWADTLAVRGGSNGLSDFLHAFSDLRSRGWRCREKLRTGVPCPTDFRLAQLAKLRPPASSVTGRQRDRDGPHPSPDRQARLQRAQSSSSGGRSVRVMKFRVGYRSHCSLKCQSFCQAI